jgi:hypothetical protein
MQPRRVLQLLLFWARGLRVHEVDEGRRRCLEHEAIEGIVGIARVARSREETEAIAGCGGRGFDLS